MLTPVEEAGLAGQRLAARIRRALYRMTDADLAALMRSIDEAARARKLFYLHDDEVDVIRLLPMPVAALPDQLSYVRTVTLALHGALARMPDLYFADPDVHDLLALPDEEEAWLREYWKPHVRDANFLFGRHDAVIDFRLAAWKSSFHFIEPNLSGIGGLHMIPTAEQILGELVLPILHANDPALQLEIPTDIRALLMQELVDHLEAIGRAGNTICFIEPKYEGSGPDEQGELTRHFHERFGLSVFHADPSELELSGDQVCYQGRPIDLAYRDYSVGDLLEIAGEGVDVAPMRALFAENRIVSSIAAELDQKSMFEVLGDPYLSARHFSGADRNLFQRHIPWTRILTDREASLPGGVTGDLLEYVSRMREHLVLKPNRDYGGTGVLIGAIATDGEWDAAIQHALTDEYDDWVAQWAVNLPVLEFPVLDAGGAVQAEPFYTVMGFAPSRYGLATLGRASQKRVVNVAQRGGMFSLMVGHAPGRLII
ncbi:MAG TPA: hypothetical protein VIG06_09545 [Kofleriaceae bacterium]